MPRVRPHIAHGGRTVCVSRLLAGGTAVRQSDGGTAALPRAGGSVPPQNPSSGTFLLIAHLALAQHPVSRPCTELSGAGNPRCGSAWGFPGGSRELFLSLCSARMPESSWDFSTRPKPGKCFVR